MGTYLPGGNYEAIFGERHSHCDYFFKEDLQCWHKQGMIKKLNVTFSRDHQSRVYVQHKLADEAELLTQWVNRGASIYVCGSVVGMAPAIDQVIRATLGDQRVDELISDGRYRRDVY